MKRVICLIAIGLLVAAMASAMRWDIAVPDGFSPRRIVRCDDESFLISGSTTEGTGTKPTILKLDERGTLLWTFQNGEIDAAYYSDARHIDDNAIIALRSVPDTYEQWVVERIEQGDITYRIEIAENNVGLMPFSGGFLLYGNSDQTSATIKSMSFSDEVNWTITLDDQATVYNVLSATDGSYVAYGGKIATDDPDYGEYLRGFVLRFNNQGEVFWYYESITPGSFSSAVIVDEDVVLVGNTSPNDEGEMLPASFLCKYSEAGLEWQIDFEYDGPNGGFAQDVIQVEGGFLVLSDMLEESVGVIFSHFDVDGKQVNQWVEPMDEFSVRNNWWLYTNGDETHLLTSGEIDTSNQDFHPKQSGMYIMKVDIP